MTDAWLDADQLSVLVIDDDPGIVALIAEAMLREEHQVVTANSAERGLEQLPYYTFQIAFIDYHLPEMNGLVLAGYLREHNPEMQIAVVTGEPDQRLRDEVEALGLTLIEKPFDIKQLFAGVDAYRRRAAARDLLARQQSDATWLPSLRDLPAIVAERLQVPSVPERVAESLAKQIKACLSRIRSSGRYDDRDRIAAFAGLVAARVLGVELPKTRDGLTLWERYDELMRLHGRRVEFSAGADSRADGAASADDELG